MPTMHFQPSLLDVVPEGGATLGPLAQHVERTLLSHGAWVDVRPGWVSGSDEVFERLAADVPWRAERRQMHERIIEVPRLLCFYGEGVALPHSLLDRSISTLTEHYRPEPGEGFVTAGLCYYRDGRDSVAWHGDTIGRAGLRTQWSPSCRSAVRADCCCGHVTAVPRRSVSRWATAT